ncbi:hypothetical protein AHAS_Ahas17G0205600 [Arachis hypogaea]
MGLEIIEEFRPITPIRTVATSSSSFKHVKDLPDLHTTTITEEEEQEDEEECRTPTSPSQTLTTLLECPPALKEQRHVHDDEENRATSRDVHGNDGILGLDDEFRAADNDEDRSGLDDEDK